MKFLIWILAVAALVTAYAAFVRPWLRQKPWAELFFRLMEPIELLLWRKSETILVARTHMVLGVLMTVLTQAGSIDIAPLMPLVPDVWEPIVLVIWNLLPLTITLLGALIEKLRKDTTKPLDLVALPEAKPPEVAAAVAKVEASNAVAVAVVEGAKAEGAV